MGLLPHGCRACPRLLGRVTLRRLLPLKLRLRLGVSVGRLAHWGRARPRLHGAHAAGWHRRAVGHRVLALMRHGGMRQRAGVWAHVHACWTARGRGLLLACLPKRLRRRPRGLLLMLMHALRWRRLHRRRRGLLTIRRPLRLVLAHAPARVPCCHALLLAVLRGGIEMACTGVSCCCEE